MLSKVVRRVHMYLALFLAPWVLCYALSTIVMNHSWTQPASFQVEGEVLYEVVFSDGTPNRAIGQQVLADLDLEGAFGVQGPRPDGAYVITRQDLVAPVRVTYQPARHMLTVERAAFETTSFLNRFHHRRGYGQAFVADRAFAVSIDLVIVAMVFWALSGLWMWWEMKVTRLWGAACGLAGAALFLLLVLSV